MPSMPDQKGLRSRSRRRAIVAVAATPRPSKPPDRLRMLLTMPITSPCLLNRGLPELPGLTAASVRKNSRAVLGDQDTGGHAGHTAYPLLRQERGGLLDGPDHDDGTLHAPKGLAEW